MQKTTIDRRSLLKIVLAGAGAPALLQVDAALASAPTTPTTPETRDQAFVAPAMCPELHIAYVPEGFN